jgi:hypothetical protein
MGQMIKNQGIWGQTGSLTPDFKVFTQMIKNQGICGQNGSFTTDFKVFTQGLQKAVSRKQLRNTKG